MSLKSIFLIKVINCRLGRGLVPTCIIYLLALCLDLNPSRFLAFSFSSVSMYRSTPNMISIALMSSLANTTVSQSINQTRSALSTIMFPALTSPNTIPCSWSFCRWERIYFRTCCALRAFLDPTSRHQEYISTPGWNSYSTKRRVSLTRGHGTASVRSRRHLQTTKSF